MIDGNSPCPCGSGKKIKFCCSTHLEDFKKLIKFLNAEQFMACSNYLDSALTRDPNCAGLLAIRCHLLMNFPEKDAELVETCRKFYQLYPKNPLAIGHYGRATIIEGHMQMEKDIQAAPPEHPISIEIQHQRLQECIQKMVSIFIQWFHLEAPFQNEQTHDKLEFLIDVLFRGKMYESAISWIAVALDSEVPAELKNRLIEVLHQIKSGKNVPLCFRAGLHLRMATEGAVWEKEFNEIIQNSVLRAHWVEAIDEFRLLGEKIPEVIDAPEFWFNVALLYEWMCNLRAATKAWERYLECGGVRFYDAVEKQTRLAFFQEYPLQDAMEVCRICVPVSNVDAVLQKLLSSKLFRSISDLQMQAMDDGLLVAGFDMLDTPALDSLENVAVEDIPVAMGNVLLWAKQTDRPAELQVINVMRGGAELAEEQIREVLGDLIENEFRMECTRKISVTLDSFLRKLVFPENTPEQQVRELTNEHCRYMLTECWVNFPLGILGNQSMRAAAKNPKMKIRVEVVLTILRLIFQREELDKSILDDVRQKLSLPPLPEVMTEDMEDPAPLFFDLLKSQNIAPEIFERIFLVTKVCNISTLPEEVIRFVADGDQFPVELKIEALKCLWNSNPFSDDVLDIINRGKQMCNENQLPDVFFDVMLVAYSIREGKIQTVFDTIRHIEKEHSDDQEAIQYIAQLRQYMYGVAQSLMQQEGTRETPAADKFKLWTPDSDVPPAVPEEPEQGAKSKLWIPDGI